MRVVLLAPLVSAVRRGRCVPLSLVPLIPTNSTSAEQTWRPTILLQPIHSGGSTAVSPHIQSFVRCIPRSVLRRFSSNCMRAVPPSSVSRLIRSRSRSSNAIRWRAISYVTLVNGCCDRQQTSLGIFSAHSSAESKTSPPSVATACVPEPSEPTSCRWTGSAIGAASGW